MCIVSRALRRILKFLRTSFLIAKFCGNWNSVKKFWVNGILLVSSFCDVCSLDVCLGRFRGRDV